MICDLDSAGLIQVHPKNLANLQEAIRQRLLNEPDTIESPELEHRPQIWAFAADGGDKALLPYKEVAKYAAIFLAVSLALAMTIPSILQQFDIPAGRWLRIIYFTAGGMLV